MPLWVWTPQCSVAYQVAPSIRKQVRDSVLNSAAIYHRYNSQMWSINIASGIKTVVKIEGKHFHFNWTGHKISDTIYNYVNWDIYFVCLILINKSSISLDE